MKKNILILILLSIVAGCTSVKQIGKVNMISNRNVDPNLKYQLISSYSGGSDKEIRRTKSKTVEDALDQTVRKIPGGEFVMNAKIYLVDEQYFAVEGDVWGTTGEISYRGFKTLDKVTWKKLGAFYTGIITALKDNKSCYVKQDNSDKTVELSYDDITKTDNNIPTNNTTNTNTNLNGNNNSQTNQPNSKNGFTVGDKVKFENLFNKTMEGKIIKLKGEMVKIEYLNNSGNLSKIKLKFGQFRKAE